MRTWAAVILITGAWAGCLGDEDDDADDGGDDAPPGTVGWALDCGISNWDERCNVRASPNDSPSKTEIDMAVNPTDPMNVFVASKDLDTTASDCVWSVGQVTKDGGQTWTTVYVGGTKDERGPGHPLAGIQCITDPILAFDSQGTLFYPLQAYETRPEMLPADPLGLLTAGSSFFLAVSHDGGETFPTDDIIPMAIADGTVVFHDYPRMVVSPATDAVHTVWNAVGLGGINPYVVTTRDGGATVDPPVIVAFPDAPRSTAFASGFAATSDGTVYMTIEVFSPVPDGPVMSATEGLPWLAISTDDARTFQTFKTTLEYTGIDCPLEGAEFRCGTFHELAADTSGGTFDGRLYMIWPDARNDAADILVAWTDDQGDTWSEPVRVTPQPNEQFMARATVSHDGTVHLVYLDRQYDATPKLLDVTHSWSTDGGATWQHERLTTTSFDGDLGVHQDGFPFIGDYIGIGAVGPDVWFGFPTTQTGMAEIGVAHSHHMGGEEMAMEGHEMPADG